MPTAPEFDTMATRFDDRATTAESMPRRLMTSIDATVLVGPLTEIIDQMMQVSSLNLSSAAGELRSIATVCRERAADCRRYTAQVDTYRAMRNDPITDRSTLRPPSKKSWMEYGHG